MLPVWLDARHEKHVIRSEEPKISDLTNTLASGPLPGSGSLIGERIMQGITEIDLALISPQDAAPERDATQRVVDRLNRSYCAKRGLHLALHRWEDVAPVFHKRGPQAPIDRRLRIRKIDIVIGVIWQRIGTPMKNGSLSGTQHEFQKAYRSWMATGRPQIMFYFKKPSKPSVSAEQAAQLEQALRFKETFPGEGLYRDFSNTRQFESLLHEHLENVLDDLPRNSHARNKGPAPLKPRSVDRLAGSENKMRHAVTEHPMSISITSHRDSKPRVQAVVFTHFGALDRVEINAAPSDLADHYKDIFKAYCLCKRVGIVYVYLAGALGKLIAARAPNAQSDELVLPVELFNEERALIGWLSDRCRVAREELCLQNGAGPRFHFVGLGALLELLAALQKVDPGLISFLHGPSGAFTYDSPKFVEAVIRLARGDSPNLAVHPVVRIDEDAWPNDQAISALLDQFVELSRTRPFYLFSGIYGTYGPASQVDHINDHAVRSHWFYGVCPSPREAVSEEIEKQVSTFLADIDLLGAKQFSSEPPACSTAAKRLVAQGTADSARRPSSQVISGAGLIMSRKAVDLLPPFMNFANLTLWVDDHLKRRLHEALGDMKSDDLECCHTAKFHQDRHPRGITASDIARSHDYFARVLRGCLLDALIIGMNGARTPYSDLIRDIVLYRATGNDDRLDVNQQAGKRFREILVGLARERAFMVQACWTSHEFKGSALWKWATKLDDESQETYCLAVVDDAIAYARLVGRWHVFVRAIQRLPYFSTDWLFEPVPD